ncbi:hypothetical protein HY041_00950, partial [Candidatus Roizmanbacteria bacterium]|nr:hypothetical protein [Candidatus Roizmanbacteria bacterium]
MENNPKESVGIAEPSLSEKRDDIGIVSPHDERVIHEKRHIFPFPFLLIPLFVLLFLFATAVLAQEQIHGLIAQITKPKPITQSSKVLPVDIQQAIETEAKQQIAQQKATALIATSTSGRSTNQGQNGPTSISNNVVVVSAQTSQGSSFILNIIYPFQLLISVNSRDKAKVRLAHIDREIQEVQALLTNGLSDSAVNQAVSIIQNIGQETGEIIADKQVQTDREILTLQIEQYTRLQLTLQKIEDTLPIDAYLKVETARQKYIVPTAIAAINAAPNLDIIHTISTKQIQSIVGKDFGELKTIEILTDLQNGLTHQAQQKLQGLQKQVTLQFEKRMLTFPSSERIRKLQNYIKLSYGNSLNQAESFEQMKYFLTDREMILGADSLKELALQKLENRIFQIQNQSELNAFLELSFRNPSDLKILAQMKLDVLASNDESKKKYIVDFENNSLDKIIAVFGNTKNLQSFFAQSATPSVDIVDVSVITQLATTLQNAPQVSGEVKSAMENIKEKTLQNFVAEIAKTDFTTAAKVSYNPVSQNADVRILLPAPQAILLLEEVRSEVSGADKLVIDIAQKAESNILVDYLLTQVNDPQIFQEYQNTIATNPEVKKILTSDTPQSFFTTLDQKAKILDDQRKANNQQLYETIQQITQSIFITPDNQIAKDEQKLPETIQQEIQTLKNELPDRSIPQLTIPEDVKLSAVPTLPSDVQDALITAAKEEINSQKQSNQTKLDISVEAKDLGLSIPVILPDNPLYPLKNIIREIPILLTTDPIQKAEELIKIDNEKTIEAAKLVEESQSIVSIGIALNVLKSVKKDFDILKQNVDQVKKVEQTEPEKVDRLVTQIIDNGLIRQTVFSSIENHVYGEAYLAVEQIRQDILKDGVDTLLALTDNNVQKLTDKLENIIISDSSSPITSVAGDIKAVELLTEIARTEPQSAQKILQAGEANIAASLEKILLSQPAAQRTQEVSSYIQEATGNP